MSTIEHNPGTTIGYPTRYFTSGQYKKDWYCLLGLDTFLISKIDGYIAEFHKQEMGYRYYKRVGHWSEFIGPNNDDLKH